MAWTQLLHLGDSALTIPAGGAIAAWLLAARAWRAALGWSLVFALVLGLVAATKIAFMGWATGVPALDFKALSGHATGFAAVCPTLCYLAARGQGDTVRALPVAAGLMLSGVVAAALVQAGEHTVAEAAAGWLTGTAAFLVAVHLAGNTPVPPPGRALACALLAFLVTARLVHGAPLGWWMIKAALVLSGNTATTPWHHCG